jgi:hypothetical protein
VEIKITLRGDAMIDECSTQGECVDLDLDWLKDELRGLTKAQRRLILEEYADHVKEYRIGMSEYKSFVKVFDELED